MFAGKKADRIASHPQDIGIVPTRLDRLSCQQHRLRAFRSQNRSPSLNSLEDATPANHRRGRCVGRIDRQRTPRQDEGLLYAFLREFMELRHNPQIQVVSVEAVGRLSRCPLDLRRA